MYIFTGSLYGRIYIDVHTCAGLFGVLNIEGCDGSENGKLQHITVSTVRYVHPTH